MINSLFKRAIFFSAFAHLAVFSIFNFSFGEKIPQANNTPVYFWGAILGHNDSRIILPNTTGNKRLPIAAISAKVINSKTVKAKFGVSLALNYHFKPRLNLIPRIDKLAFVPKLALVPFPAITSRAQEIMFYPSLPHYFLLYFKDRQVAHIQVMFKIISDGKKNSLVLKRKVSSGNLEADLLSMRYISHYLFVQQGAFPLNSWQTVKIDLSPNKK